MDKLDVALKVALIDHMVGCDEVGGVVDLSNVYEDTIETIKGLCHGSIDISEYLDEHE